MCDVGWEGRIWTKSSPYYISRKNVSTIRVISYRVGADFKTTFMHHSIHKAWEKRSQLILKEIESHNADIYCLQEIDHFHDFWYSNFMLLGYDVVYKQRTQEKDFHYEGIMIAFKSHRFQMFRSVEVEFNNAVQDDSKGFSFRERCKTDDVALIAFLQPYNCNDIPTSVCVCCAMLDESLQNPDVRAAHTTYLTEQIQLANREFQLPVIACININDVASSLPYTVLRSGRQPLSAQIPSRCRNVTVEATSRSTALVKWLPPKMTIADPPILVYRISWRPGGSSILGFSSQVELAAGDCIKYVQVFDDSGHKKIVAASELQTVIRSLAAEVPYEFRVCAVNDMGEGVWTDPTEPVVLMNPQRAPTLPPLKNFASLEAVYEMRESKKMEDVDWNVNDAFRADPVNSLTQLTPRTIDGRIDFTNSKGRILPVEVNPRSGWKDSLDGQPSSSIKFEMNRDYILGRSLLRDREGFLDRELNYFVDKSTPTPFVEQNVESFGLDGSTLLLDCREALHNLGLPNSRFLHNLLLRSAYESYCSGGEPITTASYPKEKGFQPSDCADFIFYSSAGLINYRVLSLPNFSIMKRGETPEIHRSTTQAKTLLPSENFRSNFDDLCMTVGQSAVGTRFNEQATAKSDNFQLRKHSKSDIDAMKRKLKDVLSKSYTKNKSKLSEKSSFWGGKWVSFPEENTNRKNYHLPNNVYGSTHLAIGAEFLVDETILATVSY